MSNKLLNNINDFCNLNIKNLKRKQLIDMLITNQSKMSTDCFGRIWKSLGSFSLMLFSQVTINVNEVF